MSERRMLSPLFTWRSAIASKSSPLTATQRHVALTLSLHMSEKGDSCFPKISTLVGETERSDSTVRDSLKALSDIGWLERDVAVGRGNANSYRAMIPEYFDPDESKEENRRRAVEFEADGNTALSTAALMRDTDGESAAAEESAGERRLSADVTEIENHRTAATKPPDTGIKTAGERLSGERHEDVTEVVTEELRSSLGESAADRDYRRMQIELQLGVALSVRLEKMTASEKTTWSRFVDELVEVGATGDDVAARCDVYRERWPQLVLTVKALVNNWSSLGAQADVKTAGFDVWLARDLFDRVTTHEIVADTPGLDEPERARRHRLVDQRFDERREDAA